MHQNLQLKCLNYPSKQLNKVAGAMETQELQKPQNAPRQDINSGK